MVAARHLDGGHHLLCRHAEPCHRPRAYRRRQHELDVVGVPITGMLTVFFYAKLWRRSGALTDINFYELRYSGAPARFLRGFRAVYLGVFFNIVIMATVTLAAIKIAGALLGLDPYTTVALTALLTMVYATTSGLWGVLVTDLFQFVLAMIGSVAAAYYAVTLPEVGGCLAVAIGAGLDSTARFRKLGSGRRNATAPPRGLARNTSAADIDQVQISRAGTKRTCHSR